MRQPGPRLEALDELGRKYLPHHHEDGILARQNGQVRAEMSNFISLLNEEKISLTDYGRVIGHASKTILTEADLEGTPLGQSIKMLKAATEKRAHQNSNVVRAVVDKTASLADLQREAEEAEAAGAAVAALETGTAGEPAQEARQDPGTLPPLDFQVRDLRMGTLVLGEAQLRAHPVPGGLRIDTFSTRSEGYQLDAQGDWLRSGDDGGTRSDFDVRFSARALGDLLNTLQFNAKPLLPERQGGCAACVLPCACCRITHAPRPGVAGAGATG